MARAGWLDRLWGQPLYDSTACVLLALVRMTLLHERIADPGSLRSVGQVMLYMDARHAWSLASFRYLVTRLLMMAEVCLVGVLQDPIPIGVGGSMLFMLLA